MKGINKVMVIKHNRGRGGMGRESLSIDGQGGLSKEVTF